jgi:tellurite resistance protein
LFIIILVIWGCFSLFSGSKKKPQPKAESQSYSEASSTEGPKKRDANMQADPNDDELATFTISVTTSYGGVETKSKNKAHGRWIQPGELISVAEYEIRGGFFYFGGALPDLDGYGTDASLVDSSLPIKRHWDMLYQDDTLRYWPSFNRISDSSRGAYIAWLASDRNNPNVPMGYVFIYFYGLERRILVDSDKGEVTDEEFEAIYQELHRLRSIYGISRSFSGYSRRLMEMMALIRPGIVVFNEKSEQTIDSLLFRFQLATLVAEGTPIPPNLAFEWLKNTHEYTIRTPARRCAEYFATLFQQQYADQFGDGLIVKPNKTRLTLHYNAASASLRGFSLEQPSLPDPSVLKAPVKKLIAIADECTESLASYSRYLGKKGASEDDIEAVLLLPDALINSQTSSLLKQFQKWTEEQLSGPTKGLIRVAEFWEQIGLEVPERINKKEVDLITSLAEKAGYGVVPDPSYHNAKPSPEGSLVLFPKGHGPYFNPSKVYQEVGIALRLAAMIASVDGHVDDTVLSMLHKLIDHNTHLAPIEKCSLHAYLHWLLNTPANMSGLKARIATLEYAEKEVVRHILVNVALADGKVTPNEIKQLEKLYTTLGLDRAQVASDVHKLTSSKSVPVTKAPPLNTTEQTFALNDELLAFHSSETSSVQNLLGSIFVEDVDALEELAVTSNDGPQPSDTAGLDHAHNTLFTQLITKERWVRKDVVAICDSLKLMLDGAIETINDWAYEQVDSPVIDEDEDIYVDLEIANELKAGLKQ